MNQLREYIDEYFKTQTNEIKDKIFEIVSKLTVEDIKDNVDLFSALVPPSGKADTVAGEILRALHKVGYRYYNDGDHYFEGYGLETCGSNAVYLIKHTNQIISTFLKDTAPIDYIINGGNFNTSFEKLISLIRLFLVKTPALFITRNTIDSTYDYTNEANELFDEYDSLLNGTDEEDDF